MGCMDVTTDDALVAKMIERIQALVRGGTVPVLVALDGRSGAGKSTLAAAVRQRLVDCAVVDGDDFYAGRTAERWDALSAEEKAAGVIDWRRQRPVLEALAAGRPGRWHGFDWETFDGALEPTPTVCEPASVVILDGAYSGRPELADLFDLRVLLHTEGAERHRRLRRREGDAYADDWFARWNEAEEFYFGSVVPPESFDLVLVQAGPPG
jgi:uridine kinase